MSRWGSDGWYPTTPKRPPPERGIRMKKAGTTWWGQRWVEALEGVLGGGASRLARGKTYARAGRTHDVVTRGGKITAQVTGSRDTPYEVVIQLTELSPATWKKAIVGMARKAQFSAELLAGQMPEGIDEVFRDTGASLFPKQRKELQTSCTCPDWGDPCKHVAATHYVLGEALDRDPFLLFELRGKTKEQVLDALRAARSGASTKAASTKAASTKAARRGRETRATLMPEEHAVPTVQLGRLTAAEYDEPRGALPALQFTFDEPVIHGAVLRQLGAPAAWKGDASPADVLTPLVRTAAQAARRLALAEPASEPTEPTTAAARPRAKGKRATKRRRAGASSARARTR